MGWVSARQPKFPYLKESHWHTVAVSQRKVDGREEEHTRIKDLRPCPCRVYLMDLDLGEDCHCLVFTQSAFPFFQSALRQGVRLRRGF